MLNPNAPIPLYRQLADLISARIRSGEYAPGSRIPSEHQLATAHGIGRPTIRQALDMLIRKGLLTRRRGSGTFVLEPQQEVDLFSLDGTSASFRKKGLAVETRLLAPIRLQHVSGAAENPFDGQQAYCFSRLTRVAGAPVLLEALYLHAQLFDGIQRLDLEGRSLSAIAEEQYYLRPSGGKQSFRIAPAEADQATLLAVSPRTPLLAVQRWLTFPQTPCGVFSELWCRTDQFVFTQTIGGTGYA